MRHPAGGIPPQRGLIERDRVPIHPALRPGQGAQNGQQSSCGGRAGRHRHPRRDRVEAGGRQGKDREAGQILEVVGNVGENERIDIEESKDGKKGAGKKESCGQRTTRPAVPPNKAAQQPEGSDQPKPLPEGGCVHGPAGIDEDQLGRPGQLAEVEPEHPARQQAPLHQAQVEIRPLGADEHPLKIRRDQAGARAQGKPGQQGQHVAPPIQAAAAPPENHEQCGRQRGCDSLGQQPEQEKPAGQDVVTRPAIGIEAKVDKRGREVEYEREGVLLLGNPRD